MPEHYDVIVAGAGSMGAAACHSLAKKGVRVLGLDSQSVPSTNASYNGNTRVIRLSYFEHPDYVPLLREAFRLWNELEQETNTRLLEKTGILYLGNPDSDTLRGVKLASEQHHLDCTSLSHDEVRKHHPQFAIPESMVGAFEPMGGYLLSDDAVTTFAASALRHGARIHAHEPVLHWQAHPQSVTVTTPRNSYHAGHLILASGAWSHPLLQLPRLQLKVTRQILGWVWPRRPERFRRGEFPVWNIDPGPTGAACGIYYGFPLSTNPREGIGLKLAHHFPSMEVDPDAVTQETTEADREELNLPLQRYLPDGQGELLAIKVCRYTNSADGHFIIDQHPDTERVHIACGFSGHGFKFSSVMGKILSDLATDGKTNLPIAFLGFNHRPLWNDPP